MLNSNPIPQLTVAANPIPRPASSQKLELMSFFWHAGPPQCTVFVLPSESFVTVLVHLHVKQAIVLPPRSSEYFRYGVPWPEQLCVAAMAASRVEWQTGRMAVMGAEEAASVCGFEFDGRSEEEVDV